MHLIVNCPRNSEIAFKFKLAKQFLSYWSKQYFDCFDPYLKTACPTKIPMPFLSSLDNLCIWRIKISARVHLFVTIHLPK